MAEKNIYISIILSFFVTGLGNIYNGFIKRGAVEFIIAMILGLIAMYVFWFIGLISIFFTFYVMLDSYHCATAINNNQPIPKFLGAIELE